MKISMPHRHRHIHNLSPAVECGGSLLTQGLASLLVTKVLDFKQM